jgi:hypothetical protein
VRQRRGKAKVLESQWPSRWWEDEGKNRKIFNILVLGVVRERRDSSGARQAS